MLPLLPPHLLRQRLHLLRQRVHPQLRRPAGRRETPGRPMQYATTPAFLAHFGLETRRDLPGLAELKAAGLLEPLPDPIEGDSPGPGDEGEGAALAPDGSND